MVSKARALSAKSLLSVEPSLRMSMASCLELSKKLFWMVLVTDRAPSFSFPAYKRRHTCTLIRNRENTQASLLPAPPLDEKKVWTWHTNHGREAKENHYSHIDLIDVKVRVLNWLGRKEKGATSKSPWLMVNVIWGFATWRLFRSIPSGSHQRDNRCCQIIQAPIGFDTTAGKRSLNPPKDNGH